MCLQLVLEYSKIIMYNNQSSIYNIGMIIQGTQFSSLAATVNVLNLIYIKTRDRSVASR